MAKLEIATNFNVVKSNVVTGHFSTVSEEVVARVKTSLQSHTVTPISFSVTKGDKAIGCFQTKQGAQDLINLMSEMGYTFMRNQLD
jgi:hypothetical protein